MNQLRLLYRLIGRPLVREPFRSLLTVLCVAIGVAVIIAIDMAADAAAGSFESSMESMHESASYEIGQVGGIPETAFGELSRLQAPLSFSARVEGFATLQQTGERVPLFGVDLVGDETLSKDIALSESDLKGLVSAQPAWVSEATGLEPGERVDLAIDDRLETITVRGLLAESEDGAGSLSSMVVMDIALAQRMLHRVGYVDRIYVYAPSGASPELESLIRSRLPPAAALNAAGVRSRESRKLLNSFRWNLQVISYIALIVGAFLIFNTISVRVVRRRSLIGVARAIGMSSRMVYAGFLGEGVIFGIAGSILGLVLGRALAVGAVQLMGRTVQSLYASGSPGELSVQPETIAVAMCAGVGVSVLSAWWPAREASSVPPTEAMARGREQYDARAASGALARWAGVCCLVSVALCFVPAWERVPYAGFAAALGLIVSAALLVPKVAQAGLRLAATPLLKLFGIAAMIGSRILAESLGRTAVIVAALSTAMAMIVSVGIMVGSLRETVMVWMDNRLQADLYVRAELAIAVEEGATIAEEAATAIESLPEVELVDRIRRYSMSYNGLPATLALVDFGIHPSRSRIKILEGPDIETVSQHLISSRSVIASEPFSSKHNVHVGDTITLPLGNGAETFEVAAVYHDYSAEQGYLVGHRDLFMNYLPDTRLTGIAVYLSPGVNIETGREQVIRAVSGRRLQVLRNRELREVATESFDRTFAITDAIGAVALLVAILGMAGAFLTLVIDRRAELGLLRTIGATKSQVRRLVLAQAGMLGLLSNAVGCVLGGGLAVVLIKVINKQSFGWTIQFHWPIGLLVAATTAIFAASLAAGTYPAHVAATQNPIDVLHEE